VQPAAITFAIAERIADSKSAPSRLNPTCTTPLRWLGVASSQPAAYSRSASFSPDGQKILFQSGSQVYMMNADGSNQDQVSKYPNTCMYPSWSPDGTSISYITANDTISKIVVADLNGNNERLLVPNSSSYQYYYNWHPVK
jgi:TolB protein